MYMNLLGMLESMPVSPKHKHSRELKYYVRSIPKMPKHLFGRDSRGFPCLLLSAKGKSLKAPVKLSGIEAHFSIPCSITTSNGQEITNTFTTVLCTSQESVIQSYFAHVCETIIRIIGPEPTLQQVIDVIRHIVDLFQRLTKPSVRSAIGLFGELYVIHTCASAAAAVKAWRSATDDRFDFSTGNIRLEVKASGTRQRIHSFSLEQCIPPPETLGILISLFVEPSSGGLSILDLVRRIEKQLEGNVEHILKLQEAVAEVLGSTMSSALPMCFDEELAKSSLRVYELNAIPAIRDGVPDEVSQIHFRSDISGVQVADVASFSEQYQQIHTLLPVASTHRSS